MSQDIISNALNQIMNAKTAGAREAKIKRVSKVLIGLLEMMKTGGYVDFELFDKDENSKKPYVIVKILKLNECRAVKPRYYVRVDGIDKYLRRFLPSRNFGTLVISTNKGLMSHKEAVKENLGGSVVAYFY